MFVSEGDSFSFPRILFPEIRWALGMNWKRSQIGRPWLPCILALLTFAAVPRLAAQSPTPFRIDLEFGDEWSQPVYENDEIRVRIIPTGGQPSDPAIELRWWISVEAGAGAELPSPTEGVELMRPGDPARWITLKVPDDTETQSDYNRSIYVEIISSVGPTVHFNGSIPLMDNDYRFADGVLETLGEPALRLSPAYFYDSWGMVLPNLFTPTPDGGAYFVSHTSTATETMTSVLRHIRPDLTLDPDYRAETPTNSSIIAAAPIPGGGVVVLVNREIDGQQRSEVVRLDAKGIVNVAYTENARASLGDLSPYLVQATDDGGAYLGGSGRIVRLTADGTVDRQFKEATFNGDLVSLVRQDEKLYALGSFSDVAGLGTNRFGAFRMRESTGTDPSFSVILETNQNVITQLAELGDGRLIIHGAPLLNLHSNSGALITNLFKWEFYSHSFPNHSSFRTEWHALARLRDGRVVGSSWILACEGIGCGQYVNLESIDSLLAERGLQSSAPAGAIPLPIPRNLGFYFSSSAVYAAGDYLWFEESRRSVAGIDPIGERMTYRRVRWTDAPAEGFGMSPSHTAKPSVQSHQPIAVVRRFGSSARATQLEARISSIASDPPQTLHSSTVSVSFQPGETLKPVYLPEGTHLAPGSVAIVRTTLLPGPQAPIEGAATAGALVVSVSPDVGPKVGIHRFGTEILGGEPIFSLTGPPGVHGIRYSVDGAQWKPFDNLELTSGSPFVLFETPSWVHDGEPALGPDSEMLLLQAIPNP